MTPIIDLRGICKVYEMETVQVHALRGIDLVLETGEFTAIMGASGSGKSTLLNVLGCLDQPSAGTYLLEGERVDRFDEERLAECRRTQLGFVFQSFNLLARSTSLERKDDLSATQVVGSRQGCSSCSESNLFWVGPSKVVKNGRVQIPSSYSATMCGRIVTAVPKTFWARRSWLTACTGPSSE